MSGAKAMSPDRDQLPPREFGASQIVVTGPPDASMRRSFDSEKKAIDLPSGDQNGERAPSVPASGVAGPVPSDWTHSLPPAPYGGRAPPGGQVPGAASSPVSRQAVFSGGRMNEWAAPGRATRARRSSFTRYRTPSRSRPATAHATGRKALRPRAPG